jgi:hypothetical protein
MARGVSHFREQPMRHTHTIEGIKYNPKKYYEQIMLKADIDPSDARGIRRMGALQHWSAINDMVDTSLSEKSSVFVGNWEVNSDLIYHRHLELGSYTTFNGHDSEGAHPICPESLMPDKAWEAFIVVDVVGKQCELCKATVPGEVELAHAFFQ